MQCRVLDGWAVPPRLTGHQYCRPGTVSTALHGTALCTVLHCTTLHCTVLQCIVMYCIVLYCIALNCNVPCCTVGWCIVRKLSVLLGLCDMTQEEGCHTHTVTQGPHCDTFLKTLTQSYKGLCCHTDTHTQSPHCHSILKTLAL